MVTKLDKNTVESLTVQEGRAVTTHVPGLGPGGCPLVLRHETPLESRSCTAAEKQARARP